jgi:hypothetical protein
MYLFYSISAAGVKDSDVWTLGLRGRPHNGAWASGMDEVSGIQQDVARLVEACTGCRAENEMQH